MLFCALGPGGHTSKFSLCWLAENSYEGKKESTIQPRVLWNADIYNNSHVASSKWDTFMSSDNELKTFLQNYLLYGIAFVDDVPATVEATEAVTQRVSLIRYNMLISFRLYSVFLPDISGHIAKEFSMYPHLSAHSRMHLLPY